VGQNTAQKSRGRPEKKRSPPKKEGVVQKRSGRRPKKKGSPKKAGEIKDKYTDVRFHDVFACEKGIEKEMVKIWRGSLKCTVKKGYRFPIQSRDVNYQTLPGRK
jgi:hypothetical protein